MRLSNQRNQSGLASIVVVSVLIVLVTLISLGFARIMNRAVTNSTNRQFGNTATYAAQSGINDVINYMTTYAQNAPPGTNPWIKSDNCRDLIDKDPTTGAAYNGPFSTDVNLGNNTSLTCILLNPGPTELRYDNVPQLHSQVIKMTTSAFAGQLNSMMVSWQANNTAFTNTQAVGNNSLPDQIAWNSPSCGSGGSSGCVPMLRLTLYPVPVDPTGTKATMDYLQKNSRTVFLYPQSGSSITPAKDYVGGLSDGQILPVSCNSKGSDPGSFVGSADYQCNLIITNLKGATPSPDQVNYFYVRLTPIYGQADIKIKANDFWNQQLQFQGVQAVVDVTAKISNVSKRLQARVDTGNILSAVDGNESALSNNIPEDSLRSATTLCKRVIVHNSPFQYITLDDPNNICNSSNTVRIPAPTLAFSITGNDGKDGPPTQQTVQSGAASPDNPTPLEPGTVFVNSAVTLNWQTNDITSCSTGGTDAGWNGYNVLGNSTWSGATATGSLGRTGNTVQNYSLSCTGPGGGPISGSVTLWPPPTVTLTTNPNPIPAGSNFNIIWTVNNSTICTASSSNGTWSGSKDPNSGTHSDVLSIAWNDNSTKTYSILCKDPIGRQASASITICPGGGCTVTENPPNCTADWNVSNNGNGTGTLTWNGDCPQGNAGSGYYWFSDCTQNVANLTAGCVGSPNPGVGSSQSYSVGTGHYCGEMWAGADPWGTLANSGYKCFDVTLPAPVVQLNVSQIFSQDPECFSPGNWWHQTWWCNGTNGSLPYWCASALSCISQKPPPPYIQQCADGVHAWTACDVWWQATQGGSSNNINACTLTSNGQFLTTVYGPQNGGYDFGPIGWSNAPINVNLICSSNDGQLGGATYP